MEKPCLNDQNIYPDDKVLSNALGQVKKTWDTFMNFLSETYPSFTGEWRYYHDGKSWLYKLTKKKKTICWISVYPGMFKTVFYFAVRAEETIKNSTLDKEYVDQFIHGKSYGKIKGIRVDIKKTADLAATKKLIEIKEKFK